MSGEHGEIRIPIDLDLKWAKEKLLERNTQLAGLREENSKLREDLREGKALREMSIERKILRRLAEGDNKGDFFISNELLKEIQELLTQPEQEPVEDRIARWHRLGYEQGKKASKREPLSAETIAKLWGESYSGTTQMVRNFARAIEKAHGIGGE
jgi:hypothetical protein